MAGLGDWFCLVGEWNTGPLPRQQQKARGEDIAEAMHSTWLGNVAPVDKELSKSSKVVMVKKYSSKKLQTPNLMFWNEIRTLHHTLLSQEAQKGESRRSIIREHFGSKSYFVHDNNLYSTESIITSIQCYLPATDPQLIWKSRVLLILCVSFLVETLQTIFCSLLEYLKGFSIIWDTFILYLYSFCFPFSLD